MYDLPQNTMLTFCANPMFDPVDMSGLPVRHLAEEVERFKAQHTGSMPAPETDALTFYFMNHAFHVLQSRYNDMQVLPPQMAEVAEMHIRETNLVAKRLFCYSLMIAVEEARFLPTQDEGFFGFLEQSYGKQFSDYAEKKFKGSLTDFGKLDMTCGEYARAMMSVFSFGRWQPGFGGKGWVPIAALASQCIHGSISFEGFADQAFSLCHNNGSMFNKGHLYRHYSHFIYDILDIQDSGQIPQWIASNPQSEYVSPQLRKAHALMSKFFPDEMTGKVDQSLIRNSKQKREQKAKLTAQHNAATWNQSQPPKPSPMAKQNNVLMGGLDVFKPPRR